MLKLISKKAQSTAEYAILIGLVVAVVIGMQTYVKRGVQGRTKGVADYHCATITNDTIWTDVSNVSVTPVTLYEDWNIEAQQTRENLGQGYEETDIKAGGTGKRTRSEEYRGDTDDYQRYKY